MTENMTAEARSARTLARIRALLAKADATEFPEEAQTYREHAERLMRENKVEEESLIASDPAALAPEWTDLDICEDGEFSDQFYTMWHYIARHVGVEYRTSGRYEGGKYTYMAQVVGYGSDLRVADLLYTTARMAFSAKLAPVVDASLSEEENIYRLRSAGMTRGKVAEMLWGGQTHQRNAKVGAVYKSECERRGETPALDGRGTSAALHRKVYAKEFALEIARRLRAMREGVDKSHGALQLHGREARVAEALYEKYPELRPSTEVARSEPCADCAKAKSGECRAHKYRPLTQAQKDKLYRENHSATARAAKRAGRSAAAEVDLGGTAPVKRVARADARVAGALES